ncbi:hypothetical protein [Chakrabartyella piscis]|uniref:hypothetical protein n=1 Tax=Chakrabartyella piscis TaxID=2918914 RepID=UPI002958880D|nr:hypothetical protein [Chakrabartyella piscis]
MNTNMFLLSTASAGSMITSILPIAVVCIVSIFFVRKIMGFMNKINKFAPLMYENPDQYIKEMETLMQGRVPKDFKSMLITNIAVAYMEKHNYPKALETILPVKEMRMGRKSKYEFYMNLAHIYVHLGENEKALEIIHNELKDLNRFETGGNLPRLNAFLKAFVAMEENDWVYAKEILDHVKKTFPTRMAGVDFNILYKRMNACVEAARRQG